MNNIKNTEKNEFFVLESSYSIHINLLDNKEKIIFLDALFKFVNGEELPEMPPKTQMLIHIVCQDIQKRWEVLDQEKFKRQ